MSRARFTQVDGICSLKNRRPSSPCSRLRVRASQLISIVEKNLEEPMVVWPAETGQSGFFWLRQGGNTISYEDGKRERVG